MVCFGDIEGKIILMDLEKNIIFEYNFNQKIIKTLFNNNTLIAISEH